MGAGGRARGFVTEVYRDGRVHVRAEPCDKCLLSRDRLVSGQRAREIVTATRTTVGGNFVCHRSAVSDEPEAICAAWFDRFGQDERTAG